ncbi:MAG: uncharacterized protein KVP18_002356 [Porospora cf. gigantea A]|uniref:uncharacterized protein n=1 Tax=Porospora cf. gigantea A TaxID=2853593 RepID=UPI00355A6396|nr:MAG: hypothetical protein KVP18_002356 [Porospora cf. gigantea A]
MRKFELLRAKSSIWGRLDVKPFLVVYPLLLAMMSSHGVLGEVFGEQEEEILDVISENLQQEAPEIIHRVFDLPTLYFLTVAFTLMAHLGVFLASHWHVFAKARIRFDQTDCLDAATHAMVWPDKENRQVRLVPLHKVNGKVSVDVDKLKLQWNGQEFQELDFPVDLQIKTYVASSGLESAEAARRRETYGVNNYEMTLPTFLELFKEHAVAPFFVFQMGTMVLWLLDEMWQYALMSLMMLVGLEAQLVTRRIKEMGEMHDMKLKQRDVWVRRDDIWVHVSNDDIVPGDLFAIYAKNNKDTDTIPCDALLLAGEAVLNECLLTGESVPCLKNPVDGLDESTLDINGSKASVLFAGTSLVSVTVDARETTDMLPDESRPMLLAYALTTGFSTEQGSLVRTIIFSSDRVTVDSKEAFLYLGMLSVVGIVASVYVFFHEWQEASRSRFRLLLSCILIFTSVVPPEFPVTLSMAVNLSLFQLLKARMHCTEPFRVPFAGQLTVCCFDKTGTLTSDRMRVLGVLGIPSDSLVELPKEDDKPLTNVLNQKLPFESACVMAGCHSLGRTFEVTQDGRTLSQVVGDGMEVAALASVDTHFYLHSSKMVSTVPFDPTNNSVRTGPNDDTLHIVKRFPFSSSLQRMTVITRHSGPGREYNPTNKENPSRSHSTTRMLCLSKGSPEVMFQFLRDPPTYYQEVCEKATLEGRRLLALAWKEVTEASVGLPRTELEKDMTFAGFLCFGCPIKPKTVETIATLRATGHKCVMITGDNPLTAVQVAIEIGLCVAHKKTAVLTNSTGDLSWTDRHHTPIGAFDIDTLSDLVANHTLVVTGPMFELLSQEALETLIPHVAVFARVNPLQKEVIVNSLVKGGHKTLMIGDGTNDVGALKIAHIGISLVSGGAETVEEKHEQLDRIASDKDCSANAIKLPDGTIVAISAVPPPLKKKWMKIRGGQAFQRWLGKGEMFNTLQQQNDKEFQSLVDELMKAKSLDVTKIKDQMSSQPNAKLAKEADLVEKFQARLENVEDEDVPLPKLGDASVASPFAYKGDNISCVTTLIRYGNCTLATMNFLYLLLALNSLVTAFVMSVLTLDGVKFGDTQTTVESLFISVLFFAASRASASEQKTPLRPGKSFFARSIFLSFIGQSVIHLGLIYGAWQLAVTNRGADYDPDLDGAFRPDLTNTTMFVVLASMHAASFLANYEGEPFVISFWKNTVLSRGLLLFCGFLLLVVFEYSPMLNEKLSLVPLPTGEFKISLIIMVIADLVLSWSWSKGCRIWGRSLEMQKAEDRMKCA